MGRVERITDGERAAAYEAAVSLARTTIGEERGFVHPRTPIGDLSDWEWQKVANSLVSGWICERSRQLVSDRLDEDFFLATGEVPEPRELGVCRLALPALGELCERLGLTDKTIGEWSKEDVLLFVWTAAELVNQAATSRDERPGPVDLSEVAPGLFAG